MNLGIQGRVALIVGGSGYIGRAAAYALTEEGATVILAGRTPETLTEAAGEIGASTITIDTRDAADVQRAIAEVIDEHGRIDILVNTAAPSARTLDPARDRDPAQILDAIDGKAMGYLRCADAVIPHMQAAGYGRIVNIVGQNANVTGIVTGSIRNNAAIVMSKNLADALAGSGVTVNVVNPGIVTATPSTTVAVAKPGDSTPEQVAAVITFLASEPAGAISGESIAVGHKVRGVQ
ncbi:SDR family NAD(P)-dependent oxidoreductase [Microbacteriaceae bacterium VKM Ac-2855]|nr:SDR family NAD(P)-dependent oxidoreductase [Microbacteriaceae bacterium VKM Ac-2855]